MTITHRVRKARPCGAGEKTLEVTIEFDSGWEATGEIFEDAEEHVRKELDKLSLAFKHHNELLASLRVAKDWVENKDDLQFKNSHLRRALVQRMTKLLEAVDKDSRKAL